MGLLDGKRAVVTGGASGIGLAIVRRFAEHGARIAVIDVDEKGAARAVEAIVGAWYGADVADAVAVERTIGLAAERLGGLDVLVNNAGTGNLEPLHETGDENWHRVIEVNLSSVFYATRAAVPIMRGTGGGVIVNNASGSALRPTRGESAYSAAKAGVVALTQAAAQEYGPEIRVNCVSPGLIRTPMSEALFKKAATLEPARRATPLARSGTAEEVADVFLFLACELSRFVTGQNLVVDGGMGLAQAGIDEVLRALLARTRKREA